MNKLLATFIVCLSLSTSAIATWEVHSLKVSQFNESPNQVYIRFVPVISEEYESNYSKTIAINIESLSQALATITKEQSIKHISLGRLTGLDAPNIQEEIFSYLKKNYPEITKEALDSAGNMHNPKIVSLADPLKEALLSTTYIQTINNELKSKCHEIESISIEKFYYVKSKQPSFFDAIIFMKTKKCT